MKQIMDTINGANDLLVEIGKGSLLLYVIVMLSWVAVKVVDAIDKNDL